MGNKPTTPLSSTPTQQPLIKQTTPVLKDTTFRSVLFGKSDVEVAPNAEGQMILKDQVDETLFNSYLLTLNTMAQLSRAVYCDSGILREAVLSPAFATMDNKTVNSTIDQLDSKYLGLKRTDSTYANSKEGRPMQSYVVTESSQSGNGFARYVSSPSDLTFVAITGTKLKFLNSTDLVIAFKGSSTIKNFKHDFYSQFTPADLGTIMPPGTAMSSSTTNNYVPSSFVKPLNKSWSQLKKIIEDYNPTRLFITGHSLGGAYATIFGFIMAECRAASFPNIQSIHVVSFGCPTVLADGARNTFNAHLDSGKLTLDRVVSYGIFSKLADIIPTIPVGFSHPGFQPLRTEMFPEKKTGRAYNLDMIQKVYQKGGVLGLGLEKGKYELATKTHMPNKILVKATNPITQAFAHAEYNNMLWLSAFRLYGMKNPGFKGTDGSFNTFVADMFEDGIRFKYETGEPVEEIAEEPTSTTPESLTTLASKGARRTLRAKKNKKSKTRKNK
jgi:hypothetical protein